MSELVIDRKNFKQNRVAYGISQEDIAKRCGLAMTTVSNFERFEGRYTQVRARDDNSRIIIRALRELIDERIAETFINGKREENKVEEEKKRNYVLKDSVDRRFLADKIKKYCELSKIRVSEFCKMCDIALNTFSDSVIKRNPQIVKLTIDKIMEATGWTRDIITGPNDIPVNSAVRKIDPESLKQPVTNDLEIMKPNPVIADEDRKMSSLQHDGNVTIMDEKYTFQDGNYYYEYTIVRKVKKKISKEQFMNDISKKEE